jgi:leucyl aminopeptidase (aminopeptidase T)
MPSKYVYKRTPEQRAKHAEYMRKYYEAHPGYKAEADKKHRQKYIKKLRSYDKWRNQTPERKAQRIAQQMKRYAEKKEEILAYGRTYYRANKDKWAERRKNPKAKEYMKAYARPYGLKRRHGMTIEQYDAMLAAQHGVCAICGEPPTVGFNKRLHVDHDHKTEVRRGLLCMHCNHAIERMDKYPDWASRAENYLKRPR